MATRPEEMQFRYQSAPGLIEGKRVGRVIRERSTGSATYGKVMVLTARTGVRLQFRHLTKASSCTGLRSTICCAQAYHLRSINVLGLL